MAWGRWDCTRCGRGGISGRDKQCPGCGDPREQHALDAMRAPGEAEFTRAAGVANIRCITFKSAGDKVYSDAVERRTYDEWNVGDAAVLTIENLRGVVGFRRPGRR